jgi:hypothetical protein
MPTQLKSTRRTGLCTGSTHDTDIPVQTVCPISASPMGTLGTRGDTGTAMNAEIRPKEKLGVRRDALGVVAPGAVQRATLQEYGRPNAGAIKEREPLDVEDQAGPIDAVGR